MGIHSYLNGEYAENKAKFDACEKRISETVLYSEPASQFSFRDAVQVSAFNSVIEDLMEIIKNPACAYLNNKSRISQYDSSYASKLNDPISDVAQLTCTFKSIANVMNISNQNGVTFQNGLGSAVSGYSNAGVVAVKISDYIKINDAGECKYDWDKIRCLLSGIDYEKMKKANIHSVEAPKNCENSEDLSNIDYQILLMILNSFVNNDGEINAEPLKFFLELGCTDGILYTSEGGSNYNTDCGSVLRKLSKICTAENKLLIAQYNSRNVDEATKEKIKQIVIVNNIVVATANAKPKPNAFAFGDLRLARVTKEATVIQPLYNPVGAVVNPNSVKPMTVANEKIETQPFTPQKRINIPLKKKVDPKTGISYWYIKDYAVVCEYNKNSKGIFKIIGEQLAEDIEEKVSNCLDGLKVDVPEAGFSLKNFNISDTGTLLDTTGAFLDVIGLVPVVGQAANYVEVIIDVASLTGDATSLANDSYVKNAEEEKAQNYNLKVDSAKSEISATIDRFKTVDEQQENAEAMGAEFSAIYYRKSGKVSLNDYNIDKEDFKNNIEKYNKNVATNDKIDINEIVKGIENNNLSEENKRKLCTYLKWYQVKDINDVN